MNTNRIHIAGMIALFAIMIPTVAAAQHGASGMASPDQPRETDLEERPTVRPGSWEELFVKAAHNVHGHDAWPKGKGRALRVTIEMEREQDENDLHATMWYHIDEHHVRIEGKDGQLGGRDATGYWMTPHCDTSPEHLRQHLASWPYLLAMPFRMLEENNLILRRGMVRLNDARHYSAVVNITRDREAAKHHWYMAIVRGRTGRLEAMLYYCDPDRARPPHERVPIALAYHEYETFDGVELATRWTFHEWDNEDGLSSNTIGRATLCEIAFVDADDVSFTRPEDAVAIDPPEPPADEPDESDEADQTTDRPSESADAPEAY